MGFVFNGCTTEDLLVQQRSGWSSANVRWRREDCEFVKHDKLFSKWKILVAPSDRIEQGAGTSGISRSYHVHNLPIAHFGPGVFELGVTAPSCSPAPHAQPPRKLNPKDVIVVYVGQAADIRQRLYKYGLAGAHLEAGSRSSKLYHGDDKSELRLRSRSPGGDFSHSSGSRGKRIDNGPRFFSEVFALGSSIAYRWAHTDSKVVAEQVESELLAVFDYAWNKGVNGSCRSRDILAKLFTAWPTKDASYIPRFSRNRSAWLCCGTTPVGIKVALRKPRDRPAKSRQKLTTH